MICLRSNWWCSMALLHHSIKLSILFLSFVPFSFSRCKCIHFSFFVSLFLFSILATSLFHVTRCSRNPSHIFCSHSPSLPILFINFCDVSITCVHPTFFVLFRNPSHIFCSHSPPSLPFLFTNFCDVSNPCVYSTSSVLFNFLVG